MGLTHELIPIEVMSAVGQAVASSPPLKVAGQALDVHFMTPAANLVGLEISDDRATWHVPTDADGADINGPTAAIAVDDYREVRERAEWLRVTVAADAGGPRAFRAVIGVHKLTS